MSLSLALSRTLSRTLISVLFASVGIGSCVVYFFSDHLRLDGSNKSSRCATNYKSSRCAANYIHDTNCIPDDLIIEVLSRLPYKTLVRFMCVSKSWRNLISNFLLLSPMSGLLLTFNKKLPDLFIPLLRSGCCTSNCLEGLQFPTFNPKIDVIHYCNGLFLLSDERAFGLHYYVCNPATNQCVALPEAKPFSHMRTVNHSALFFDPRKSNHYKVVRLGSRFKKTEVQFFYSGGDRWFSYIVSCGFDGFLMGKPKRLVYSKGDMHFLCSFGSCMISVTEEGMYVKLPMRAKFKLPSGEWGHLADQYLGESEGRLYYVACYSDELQIWMLRSFDTRTWLRKRTLRVENVGKAFSIMVFHTNAEVLFIRHGGMIFSYYFGSGMEDIDRLKEVCNLGHDHVVDFVSPYSRCPISLE